MGKKLTNETFCYKLACLNKQIVPLEKYINTSTAIKFKCLICGNEWQTKPNTIFGGCGCPKCSKRLSKVRMTKTNEFFQNEVKLLNSNIEFLSAYSGNHNPINCRCLICGHKWSTEPNTILHGHGCPHCADIKISRQFSKKLQEFIDELKTVNSEIEVLSTEYTNSKTSISVKCKCCGHIWKALPNNLLKGTGCPKCRFGISKGEKKITQILNAYGVLYQYQKTFITLKGVGNKKLSYDFYLPSCNLLIKYQGQQHEKPVDFTGNGVELAKKAFDKQQEHDRRKREYAESNGYKLLEIWYYDFEKIEDILTKTFKLECLI